MDRREFRRFTSLASARIMYPTLPPAAAPAVLPRYTAATALLPTAGIDKQPSVDIVKGRRGNVEKARALYEWIVENTSRGRKTRGCGRGDIKCMLANSGMGGKCAD